MRLAIVIPGFQANASDWCIPAFTNLARELAKSVDLHVFALRYPAVRRSYAIGRVHVHAVGGGALAGHRLTGMSLINLWRQALRDVEAEHRIKPFSAVLGIWATESGWLATRAAARLGIPSLVHLAGGELRWLPDIRYGNRGNKLERILVQQTVAHANLLTVPSGPIERALLRHLTIRPSRVKRWALGVDTAMFSPATGKQASAHFTFVTAGSLLPVKGYEWLFSGMARLHSQNPDLPFRWRIAGAGPLLPRLRSVITESSLEGYVSLDGEVPHDRLPDFYRGADCFVLGSRHEAQCMAALEAMACGLPWIGPPTGALVDVGRTDPPTGFLITDRTAQSLATALAAMVELPDEVRMRMGSAARKHIEKECELAQQTSRLLVIVSELTAHPAIATMA